MLDNTDKSWDTISIGKDINMKETIIETLIIATCIISFAIIMENIMFMITG